MDRMTESLNKRASCPTTFEKKGRCLQCRLPEQVCFCATVPRLQLKTRVHFFVHRRELSLASSTVNLARLILSNCEVTVHGDPEIDSMAVPVPIPPAYVLFPAEDAVALEPSSEPITLVVPDGNWRQTKKMVRRIPALASLPRVLIPESQFASVGPRLRERPREGWANTIEAVAAAVGILESRSYQLEIEAAYREFALRLRPERYRRMGIY